MAICCCSVPKSYPTLLDLMSCSTPGFPVFYYLPCLLRLTSTESVMPSDHLILCCSLLLLPSIFPNIRVFSNESVLHIRWPKYQSFSFSISPSSEYSELISFRIDWVDRSSCCPRNSQESSPAPQFKASILQHSAFFMVQLPHLFLTDGKTTALTM